MASKNKFNLANLCFANNVETNMFDKPLNFNGQLQIIEEATELPETETEPDKFTDSEEELYPLTKGQSFVNWKDVERYNKNYIKSHSLYSKGFGLMKKALNMAIETGRKHQKHIVAFNDGVQKKVLKENTNVQHNKNLIRSDNSSISIESIDMGGDAQVQVSQDQDQIMYDQNMDTHENQRTVMVINNEARKNDHIYIDIVVKMVIEGLVVLIL
ncbi:24880_t:CDS:2 [Dentiscutata erythropus]|uniref:24880_t:CDS:1 n=1 Tax=Dentiscutata erythropus TaxID=1348616 RepID=A0A9N9C7E8_9GLOM|nr:24880_t:CDS:2 [Dentiscutata erythropus]